ncbi:solute carrier family 35 member G1 isoform X2 [Anoplopoma fimbria]|uniref:solute carrier family 35 member G1 isoform X2 n=1 Tax=Anoplopoma fimbria TaxID=229290 RepID=UPI0023EA8DF3|nr:solute carrier family 35 member G1 isoform X2 [Anoplopoma fimbria]
MGDRNHLSHHRALSLEDGASVVFHKVGSSGSGSGGEESGSSGGEESGSDERTEATIYLQGNNNCNDGQKTTLCPPACCVRSRLPAGGGEGSEKPTTCPGLGLFYAFLSTVFFSIIALLVKTIEGIHAIEISAIRCFFQMLFTMPLLIYHKTGFLGPRDKRIYLVLRGFIGSNAMILLYYAVQQMPLADATVIMFSNPVFTSILAWIFLKERCTIWDLVFTVFTISGVLLIARPPFLFGEHRRGIEGNYANHIKGTIAAFAGAIGAAFTFVVLRKMGKSVHYYLSVWYYAVIGFIECIITLSVLGEWKIPYCGRDRWILMLIAVLGIAGQTFLTKALQIEKAGPVALMRTIDVVLAFIFQFIFFNRAPTMWSLGGALCVVLSTSGVALQKWYSNSRKS